MPVEAEKTAVIKSDFIEKLEISSIFVTENAL